MNENTNNDEQDNMKEKASTLSTVTIDLDTLDSTKALGEGELIFDDECRQMVDNISNKAKSNIEMLKAKYRCDYNYIGEDSQSTPNCFFIDGPRGSGKSTLLRAVRHILVNGERTFDDKKPVKLYSLADVDPTELGRGENFFIYLMGKIYALLDKRLKENNNDDLTINFIKKALKGLRDMSSGLQILMDSEGVLRNYETPEFFLENCLEKCADSSVMRKKLSSLIEILAKIVKTDVFLVTIDDADLNFSKCEDVLEYVRKYMQSPRLIFLFAGDMQLYSQIVRGMQLQNFHEKQLKYESSLEVTRNRLLNSMAEQYLMKLFPSDKQVHTSPLSSVIDTKHQILVKYCTNENELHIHGIKRILARYLKTNEENLFIAPILQLPLRSVLILLRDLTKNPYEDNTPEAALYNWKAIEGVMQHSLINYNVYHTQNGTNDIWILQKNILEYHARASLWHADLSMNANEAEPSAKQVALYLGGAVSQATMPMSAKLKYWCACFPLWQRIREEQLFSADENNTCDLLESCLKQSNGQYGSPWANLACAAMAPSTNEEFLFGRGTICILNDDCEQNNEIGQDARIGFQTLVETITKKGNNSSQDEMMAHAALSASLCRIDDSKSSYFYLSVYHLLMYIAEWLDFGEKLIVQYNPSNSANDAKTASEDIKHAIKEKLSRPLIASETQRIRTLMQQRATAFTRSALQAEYAEDKNEYIPPMAHNAFAYSWKPKSIAITELHDWIKKYAGISYISSSVDYYLAWEGFKAKCIELTYSYVAEYRRGKDSPDCPSILWAYLCAIEHAMTFLSNQAQTAHRRSERNLKTNKSIIQSCIEDFPLWKHLKKFIAPKNNAKINLKKARIGFFVNYERKRISRAYRSVYKSLLARISSLETASKAAQAKLDAAQHELTNAKTVQDVTESKFKRIQETILEISHTRNVLNSKIKELSESEQQIKQTIEQLQIRKQGIVDLINKKEQQASASKTNNESPAKNRIMEIRLRDVQAAISGETIRVKSTITERIKIKTELLEIKKRLDEFSQLEFSTRVDLEAARIKSGAAQKNFAERQEHANLLAKNLEEEKRRCAEAEETYRNYKTYNPDE